MLATILALTAGFGAAHWAMGTTGYDTTFVLINAFWLSWNIAMLLKLPIAAILHHLGRSPTHSTSDPSSLQHRTLTRHAVSQ